MTPNPEPRSALLPFDVHLPRGARTPLLHPADTATAPADYLDQLYLTLPRLYAEGASAEEVARVFGGLGDALERTLDLAPGDDLELRLFPLPFGWAPEFAPRRARTVEVAELQVDAADPHPAFVVGAWRGFLFVPAPAASGGLRRWDPTVGPGPRPLDGHVCVTVVLFRDGVVEPAICQLREVFGRDRSLRRPLYKPAMTVEAASPTATAHLLGMLRSLIGTREAA